MPTHQNRSDFVVVVGGVWWNGACSVRSEDGLEPGDGGAGPGLAVLLVFRLPAADGVVLAQLRHVVDGQQNAVRQFLRQYVTPRLPSPSFFFPKLGLAS